MQLLIIIGSQILFTIGDVYSRIQLQKYGFKLATFISVWFLIYFILRMTATFGQLYVLTSAGLGKTLTLLGAGSIIFANVIGVLFLGETISIKAYSGVVLALVAFYLVAAK